MVAESWDESGTSVENGNSASVVLVGKCVRDGLSVQMSFLPSRGVGEFGGADGRSSVDHAPLVSMEPKRRSLGMVVALRDQGRKLYDNIQTVNSVECDFMSYFI